MKRILLFISIFFICPNLFAQDWQLFNTEYTSYCRYSDYSILSNEKIDKIIEFQFEKNKISENNFQFTSTRIKPKNKYDSCLYEIRQQYNIKAFAEDAQLIDMYNLKNDTLYFYDQIFGKLRNKNYRFILPLNMDKNDSLVIDKIKIKFVESKRVKVFEGLYDSAKVFTLENTSHKPTTISNITLTQHYGIIDYFFYYNFKLCGLKKNDGTESYGYMPQKSNISNLLNLKVGDYKIWKTEIIEIGKKDEVYYTKDVCKSVKFNEDSIIVEFERTQYNEEKPWKISGVREIYVKSLWDEMCSNRQNTTHLINISPEVNNFSKMGISIVEGAGYLVYQDPSMDSNASFVGYTDNGEYLTGECKSSSVTEHNVPKIISTEIGEIYVRGLIGLGEGSITSKVSGYVLNGKQFGEIPAYLSINDNVQSDFSISPNPATDYINVVNPRVNPWVDGQDIRIFDIFGKPLLSVETQCIASLQRIDISTLPAGVYFVRVGTKVEKFVKI